MTAWIRRLIYLDTRVFEEVRTNPTATIPSVVVVFVAMLVSGIGGYLWWMLQDFGSNQNILIHSALIGSVLGLVLWCVWLGVVYILLSQVFRQRVFLEQLMRVMGLGTAPLALMGLMFIPYLSFAVGLASLALVFGLTCVAISYVCSANPAQILVANLVGFFVWAVALSALASGSLEEPKPHAPGIFLYHFVTDTLADSFSATPDLP